MPSHTHDLTNYVYVGSGGFETLSVGAVIKYQASTTTSKGGNQPHNNLQPYRSSGYIIKT